MGRSAKRTCPKRSPVTTSVESVHLPVNESIADPEAVHPSRISLFLCCVRKYCDATTLHGFKYLSEINRPAYERFYWLIALVLVYFAVFSEIAELASRYLGYPVLITFDSRSRSVEEIPFPAVTICPDNQIKPSNINLSDVSWNSSELQESTSKKLEVAEYICRLLHSKNGTDTLDPDVSVTGFEICQKQFLLLAWSSTPLNMSCNYIQPMVSSHGACLSFNMLPLSQIFRPPTIILNQWKEGWTESEGHWSPDTGFREGSGHPPDAPPWRYTGTGIAAVLHLDLLLSDSDVVCSRGGKGFFVYVHNPAEMPSSAHFLFYAEDNRDMTITLSPGLYITDPGLRSWEPEERGCYYQTEKILNFFKIYTQHNCEMECEANITLEKCHCIPLQFPHKKNTPICGPGKLLCVETVLARTGVIDGRSVADCGCLPSCSELRYEAQLVNAPRYWAMDFSEMKNFSTTMLKVKYRSKFFIGIQRTVKFGFTDFIANIGGVLSLFLGFSILSVVELVYFVLFRPCTNYARRKRLIKLQRNRIQHISSINYRSGGGIGYSNFMAKKNRRY